MNIQPGQYKIHENESELDANSILTELDKGELISGHDRVQCF